MVDNPRRCDTNLVGAAGECLACDAEQGVHCLAPDYPGQSPCPHCFESSGYIWEHGNDWHSGPWSHQTNIPCKHCNGTGTVEAPLATLEDLENESAEREAADEERRRLENEEMERHFEKHPHG